MRAASRSQTHNLLCEWIYFTCGSGAESIHDMICRTQAIASSRCRVSHVGRALGDDSLRSAKQPLWRRPPLMWVEQVLESVFKQLGKLLKEKLQRLWKPSCPEGQQLVVRLSNRMQGPFCPRHCPLKWSIYAKAFWVGNYGGCAEQKHQSVTNGCVVEQKSHPSPHNIHG